MAKAKSSKHGLSFLNSFKICRPKNPSSMIKNPLPVAASYIYSPFNSKTFDISFPSFPDPPPSTPSKITPLASAFQSKPCTIQDIISFELENQPTSYTYYESRNIEKLCNSPLSPDERHWQISPSKTEKKKHKHARKNSLLSGNRDETESHLLSCHDFDDPLKTIHDELGKKPLKQKSDRTRRFKRYGSKEWKQEIRETKPASGRLVPCMVDDEVNQSFMVVKKRSVDPYKDFKKSMAEMIVEKQIFEPRELEELLMSFCSLNSRLHHKVIIEAFTEVLNEVFCG